VATMIMMPRSWRSCMAVRIGLCARAKRRSLFS
jgi:hypothetical protein